MGRKLGKLHEVVVLRMLEGLRKVEEHHMQEGAHMEGVLLHKVQPAIHTLVGHHREEVTLHIVVDALVMAYAQLEFEEQISLEVSQEVESIREGKALEHLLHLQASPPRMKNFDSDQIIPVLFPFIFSSFFSYFSLFFLSHNHQDT